MNIELSVLKSFASSQQFFFFVFALCNNLYCKGNDWRIWRSGSNKELNYNELNLRGGNLQVTAYVSNMYSSPPVC